jgi:putative cell wall-binding protein
VGSNGSGERNVSGWTGIVDVAAGSLFTVGLRGDGTCVATGSNVNGQCGIRLWGVPGAVPVRATIAAGTYNTVALRTNGTCVSTGRNEFGEGNVGGWSHMTELAEGGSHTVGLGSGNRCVGTGSNAQHELDVSAWTGIIAVDAGSSHTIGLMTNHTCVATGASSSGQCAVSGWANVVAVAGGVEHTVGLMSDGSCVAVGNNDLGQCDVNGWDSIVSVSAARSSIGVRTDGACVAVGAGTGPGGFSDVSGWTGIVTTASGVWHTVGLRADGTCVGVGSSGYGEADVSGWTDIVALDAGYDYTVGVRADGTCVAVGRNDYGRCSVTGWDLDALPTGVLPVDVAGTSRIGTAIDASQKAFPHGAEYVILATAFNWPDALGGAALAGALGGPILLTAQNALPGEVASEIGRLGAHKAIILGGASAVGGGVETALRNALGAGNVERIAGSGRYETARKIAARTVAIMRTRPGSYDGRAFVSTGLNFPDALGASPLAAAHGWPIYLVNPATGPDASLIAAMNADRVTHAIMLGGSAVVSEATRETIRKQVICTTARLAGGNRYATAAVTAQYGVALAGLGWDKVAVATGENFPDALAGGVLQAKSGSVMLLTPSAKLDGGASTSLGVNKGAIYEVRFLGGTSAVSTAVRNAVKSVLQ